MTDTLSSSRLSNRRFSSALTRIIGLGLILAMPVFLGACSTNEATGRSSFTGLMSEEDELRVGASEHPKILQSYGGPYNNASLNSYVSTIGEKLAKVSEEPELTFTFTVLDDEVVNAFALPGGYVYLSRGLLALANSEAEMAGVIAHEIGHVTGRHSAERYSQATATNVGLTVLGVVGSVFGVPSAATQVAGLGAGLWLRSYSREQELEADMLGVRYLAKAGYDTDAMRTFFEKMEANDSLDARLKGEKSGAERYNVMSTHPRTSDRIRQAIELAAVQQAANPVVNRATYLRQIDGLTYGGSVAQGVVKGQTFLHPDLRFAFTVPDGFQIINTATQVLAKGPDDALVVFDMEDPKVAAQAPQDAVRYISETWAKSLDLGRVERISVNGLAGATAAARMRLKSGDVRDARLIAIRADNDRIFRFIFLTTPEKTAYFSEAFRRTTYSFQQLTEREAEAIQTKRIRIVTVQSGDTQESLARNMAYSDAPLERFQTLNGLTPGAPLTPGDKLKIVVE